MAKRRRVDNLLGLAVLSAVLQRPMHPYEMGRTLRQWGKDQDMRIKWGSLYTVVRNLDKHGLLAATATDRQGARPERTVYRITDAGRAELVDWVRELVSVPEAEHHRFTAGLSVLAALPPDEAVELLRQRLERLEAGLADRRTRLARDAAEVPRLFLIESEYEIAVQQAEAAWVASVLAEMISGTYPGLAEWAEWHRSGAQPAAWADLAEGDTPTEKT